MPLQKQPVSINFAKGLDTKSDPYQLAIDSFLSLQNSVFTTTGRITKRNGFANVSTIQNSSNVAITNNTTITTLNNNLLATGTNLYALSQDTNVWLNQGVIQPVQPTVLPLVRVTTSQTSPDMALAASGLLCLVYVDSGNAYYQISDSSTGQQIVSRTALPSTATNPRVFLLGQYFVITFMATVSASTHLQYISIPITTPSAPSTATDIDTTVYTLTTGYDGFVNTFNNVLYLAWSGSSSTIRLRQLSSNLAISSVVTISGHTATLISVTADQQDIWVSWFDGTNVWTGAYNATALATVLSPTELYTSVLLATMTSVASGFSSGGVSKLTLFVEVSNTYVSPYPIANTKTDYISTITCTSAGGVGSPSTILRSVGLASKAFIALNGITYVIATYGEANNNLAVATPDQNTYFLIDSSGNIYMRLAYSNGGGYAASQVLPSVSLIGNDYYTPYLITDFLATTNKTTNSTTPLNVIYTQTGVNLVNFTINSTNQYSSQIANTLHLTGGQLWMYDGVRPVEHGFHVWPDNVAISTAATGGGLSPQKYYYQFTYEWTDNQGNLHRSAPSVPVSITPAAGSLTFTSVFSTGATSLTVSSATGLKVGQFLTDTTTANNIQALTYITSIVGTTIGLSLPTTGNSASSPGDTLKTVDTATNTIYVPTLRLTYKTAPNPIRIVGYRWSATQPVYYQFTSLTSPTTNDPTVDYVTFTDTLSDLQIVGNNIIYTNGGVVEDIAAPASIHSTLFNNRLFLIDAEDQNTLWYSKQVIEAVPVEMSDLLTIYVAPTIGAQGSTGPMTALAAMDDKLIIFKQDAIYYINGIGPDNTGANSTYSDPVFITSSVGCANPNSIVLMPNGLMFQSDKGIWLLGRGLDTQYIGAPVEAYNSYTVQSAQTIPGTNQVRFILNNKVTLMYDYFFQQWGTFTNISAISATLWQNKHTYLNSFGQIFQETPGSYVDGSTPVLISLTTAWINVAGLQGYERFYFGYLLGTYYTPFILNAQIAYDYNSSAQQATPITPQDYDAVWGGEALWGSNNQWGGPGNVFRARLFPAVQKCESFQLSLQEIYDPSYNVPAGAGLTLSGLNMVIGVKKGYRTQSAGKSFG